MGILFALALLCGVPTAAAQQATLRGFVTDRSDGKPLPGANVTIMDDAERLEGVVSDRDGFYQFNRLAPGRYVLRASFVGYAARVDTLELAAGALVTHGVVLVPAEEVLGEVVVAAESGTTRVRAGQQTIRPADLHRIPTPDASGDLAIYLQTLPGVVSLGDRGGQLFIRGGTPSQNLVLVDGLLVFQPFHILGFFSAFPEDLVSHVDLYAGGFGARYSGRISSVIDVTTQEGNKQAFDASASVSPFLAGARVEGPLRRGRVSVLASLRRSVIERVSPLLLDDPLPFRFGDLFLKLHRSEETRARCSVTMLHTYDRGRINQSQANRNDVFRWNNLVVGGRCISLPSQSPILFEVNTGLSVAGNEVGDAADPERRSTAAQFSSELNLTSFAGPHRLHFGFFARANRLTYRLGEQFANVREDQNLVVGAGAYVEAEAAVSPQLRVRPGLALSLYPFTYRPGLEPRLRVTWRPGGDRDDEGAQEFSAAAGLYRQTVAGISDERDAGSMFVAWMPAPLDAPPARALHVLAGWQQPLGSRLRFAAEGYYKRLRNLPVPLWSAVARFTTALQLAESDVYGFDARLEFQRRPFYAYVGYGYAQAEYFTKQENFGVWFGEPVQRYHPPHDRRHQLSAIASIDAGPYRAGVRWQFGSGLPYTRPLGFDELIPLPTLPDVRDVYGVSRVLYDRPYGGRLPTYHRLDVSVERTFTLHTAELTVQAGAINVYDRANLFYFDLFTVERVDQLPLLPYVSVKMESR